MSKEITKGIYVDLDSLFDTRLGCLAEIDPALVEVALNENYLLRKTDNFSFIKPETFRELYDVRDVSTLKLSPPTPVIELVTEACIKLIKNSIDSPDGTGVCCYINIHPYKLSEQEIGDIMDLVVGRTKSIVSVAIIDKPLNELTFDYCDSTFDMMFMYDYSSFLEFNITANNHKKNTMFDKIVVAPEILDKEISKKQLESIGQKSKNLRNMSVRQILKIVTAPIFHLEMVDVDIFSVDIFRYRQKHE